MKLPKPELPSEIRSQSARAVAGVLRKVDHELTSRGEYVIFGGAAVALYLAEVDPGFRSTDDIDVHTAVQGISANGYELTIQPTDLQMWTVHPDYRVDAVDFSSVVGTSRLGVYLLHPVDLTILKMARWHERDFVDCCKLADFGFLSDRAIFDARLIEAAQYGLPSRNLFGNICAAYADLFEGAAPPERVREFLSP